MEPNNPTVTLLFLTSMRPCAGCGGPLDGPCNFCPFCGRNTSAGAGGAEEVCPWPTAAECALDRERSVAGVSNDIPACPIHGAFPEDEDIATDETRSDGPRR